MDPNVLLKALLADIEKYDKHTDDPERRAAIAENIVDRIADLDAWLSKGGYWPVKWDPRGLDGF